MKKLMCILFATVLVSAAVAQDVRVYRLNNIDPDVEFETYAFLEDESKEDKQYDKKNTYGEKDKYDKNKDMSYSGDQSRTDVNNQQTAGTSGSQQGMQSGEESWAGSHPDEDQIIRESLSYEFDVEGLKEVENDPDMYVQFHIYEEDRTEDDAYIDIGDYEYNYPKMSDLVSNLEDGTVVLSIVNAEKGESVWEGFAYNAYEEDASFDEKQRGLRQAVDALVTQFLADNSRSTLSPGGGSK